MDKSTWGEIVPSSVAAKRCAVFLLVYETEKTELNVCSLRWGQKSSSDPCASAGVRKRAMGSWKLKKTEQFSPSAMAGLMDVAHCIGM